MNLPQRIGLFHNQQTQSKASLSLQQQQWQAIALKGIGLRALNYERRSISKPFTWDMRIFADRDCRVVRFRISRDAKVS
jgi:hypothetical protein